MNFKKWNDWFLENEFDLIEWKHFAPTIGSSDRTHNVTMSRHWSVLELRSPITNALLCTSEARFFSVYGSFHRFPVARQKSPRLRDAGSLVNRKCHEQTDRIKWTQPTDQTDTWFEPSVSIGRIGHNQTGWLWSIALSCSFQHLGGRFVCLELLFSARTSSLRF